ncbi:sugar-binding transcriptional regulator [Priestia koreensis]|uniref:sugar-binding transcriptional regulator n=1 Tax=Priestia koreensis TaxID=284581 RepID=UPI001F58CB3E|nr:sugar-binding transcriptional regulator [Priestia koreensis]MCM3004511.1 sugar-binding transcriptional regulator [Priestia koreensis]UNL84724.1 sugar-binding transcriptional regulator [Priestia koreensis]
MYSLLNIQQKLVPELLSVMQKRYQILQYIRFMQPIGRRNLASSLEVTERVLRSEVTFLNEQNLIDIKTSGMTLTTEGEMLLSQLEDIMKEVSGQRLLETTIQKALGISRVIVVSGDSDQSPWVKKEMGRACAGCIKERLIGKKNIVAVTGGTTLASVAEMMIPDRKDRDTLFVPARGGLGEHVENQANTICAKMADKFSSNYRLLHIPDQLSDEAYRSIITEPSIRETIRMIKSADMVVHGIGDAMTMAARRQTSDSDLAKIEEGHAVGEAFGYYFDQEGNIVHKVKTVGIQLDDLQNNKCVIAVAGGSSKAKAIRAFMKQAHDSILITDEGAAKQLVGDIIPDI